MFVLKFMRLMTLLCVLTSNLCFVTPALADPPTVDLDLSSHEQNVSAAALGSFESTTIQSGETQRTVTPTDMLTAAEFVAAQQMLTAGIQTLNLSALGTATTGSFSLSALASTSIGNLVIPLEVQATHDFGVVQTLNLTGNLTNSGSLYALSTNSAVTSAVINAANICNNSGATISSVLPSEGIAGYSNTVSNLSVILNAINNIYNAGNITSAGDLTLTAGGSITNATSTLSAIMQAVNNVNLLSANIVNSGVVASQMGNINIASVMAQDILVNNISGRLEAPLGAINIRDLSFATKHHFSLWGGDVLTEALNIHSGTGIATVNVQDLVGLTNIFAGEAHVRAATNSLDLGTIELSGDPTFYNTEGDVTLNGPLVFAGAPLAIVAKGSIITASGVGNIRTSSTTGTAGAITMIAGADIHIVGSGPGSVLPTNPQNPGDTTTQLEIRGASETGGNITLTGPDILSLEAEGSTSSGTGDGGNITLIAYASPNEELEDRLGRISLPTNVTIRTGGRRYHGDVTIIAGAVEGTAVSVGPINTNSLSAGASTNLNANLQVNSVNVYAATPVLTNNQYVYIQDGVMSGSFTPGNLQSANLSLQTLIAKAANLNLFSAGNITTSTITNNNSAGSGSYNGGSVVIHAGGNISTGSINVSAVFGGHGGSLDIKGDGVVSSSGITANATASGAGGTVNMHGGTSVSPGNINANGISGGAGGKVTLSGGNVLLTAITTSGGPLAIVATGDITTISGAAGINTSSGSNNGGTITMIAGAAFTRTAPGQLTVTGASSTGGTVRLTTPNISALDSRGSAVNGNGSGGTITIVAYANPNNGSLGTVSIPTSIQVLASGRGTGTNGSVTILAGGASGTGISMDGMNSSVGAAGTGALTVATVTPSLTGSLAIDSGAITSGAFTLGTQTAAGVSIGLYQSAANIFIKTTSITDIQTITTTAPGGQINILSDTSLTIAASTGTGILMQATGTGTNAITLTALGGAITLSDDRTFTAGANGTVSFISEQANGAINISSNNTVTIQDSVGIFRAPNINLVGTNSRITSSKTSGTGLIIDNGSASTALTIRGADNTTGIISSSGATNIITANNNQEVVFAKTAGTNTATINLTAPTTINSTNSGTTINASVTVTTNNALTFNVDNGTFTYNGTLSSSGTSIAIQSTGTLTITSNGSNSLSVTGSNGLIQVASGSQLLFNSNLTFNPGASGAVSITSAAVELAAGSTLTINGGTSLGASTPVLTVSTSSLTLANNAGFNISKTSNAGVLFTSPTLLVSVANNSTGNIQTSGSSISFSAGTLTFQPLNSGQGTLQLNGTAPQLTASGGSLTIAGGIELTSDNDIAIASTNADVNVGGDITTSNDAVSFNFTGTGNVVGQGGVITALSVSLSSEQGNIGSLISPLLTAATNLSIVTDGDAYVINSTALHLTDVQAANVYISAPNDLYVDTNINTTGNMEFATTGTFHLPGSYSLTSTAGNISIGADLLDVNGNISASTGTIAIFATGTRDITVGSSTSVSNTLDLNTTVLALLSAPQIVIGESNVVGDIKLAGNINLSSMTAMPISNLTFKTGSSFLSQGNTIQAGSASISFVAGGNVSVSSLTGTTPYVAFTANNATMTASVSELRVTNSSVGSLTLVVAGHILVDGNVSSTGAVSLTTSGNTTLSVAATKSLSSSNGPMTLVARALNVQGNIAVGSGTLTIYPNDGQNVKIATAGTTSGVFDMNATLLSRLSAPSLVIGHSSMSGNVTLGGNIDFNSTMAGPLTNLSMLTASTYDSTGKTITMGSGQLVVTSGLDLSMGAIAGAAPTITLSGRGVGIMNSIAVSGGAIAVTASTWLGIAAPITISGAGSITLTHTGSNGLFTLNGNVGGGQANVTLSAASWQGIAQTSGVVTASALTVISTGGNIGSTSSRLITNASSLSVSAANRSVYITNSGSLTINSTTAGHFNLLNNNNITVAGALTTSSASLTTTANNGSLTISNNITAPNYLDLILDGSGSITQTSGLISTSCLSLISGSGNFGSSSNKLNTNAYFFVARTAGDSYVHSSNSVYIYTTANANVFFVKSNGQIEVGAAVTAGTVTLENSGNIIVTGNINATTTNLYSSGNGSILRNNGIINTTNLNLSTGTGTIGTAGNKITTTASTISASNIGGLHVNSTNTGLVTVTNIASGYVNLSVSGSLACTGTVTGYYGIELSSVDGMTVGNASTTNGSIYFTAGNDTLTITAGTTVRAQEGNLTIVNTDILNGQILIGSGANIGAFTVGTPNASKGNVTITIGTPPIFPIAGDTPDNVVENIVAGGEIFYGLNGINALPSTNTLNAIGAKMIFSTGLQSASAITLGGGVTITADPPGDGNYGIVPGGPDGSINLGLTEVEIPFYHIDSGWDHSIFQPIAYTSTIAPDEETILAPKQGILRTTHNGNTIRHSQFSKFDLKTDCIDHYAGDILVEAPAHSLNVLVDGKVIHLTQGSVVLISKYGQTIKICPLYGSNSHAVELFAGKTSMRIFPGQEVIFADCQDSLSQALQGDAIGRRRVHIQNVPNAGTFHRCELSAISLIENNYVLTQLVKSPLAQDKRLTDKLVKTMASLMSVTSSHGPYSVAPAP